MTKKSKMLVALLLAMVMILATACSSSDDDIVNEQPVNPTEPKTYTMTIQASKGNDYYNLHQGCSCIQP